MLTGIVAFEWRYATRRFTFAAAAALFALMGFVLGATGFGAQDIHVNSPYAVAYSMTFLSLTSVFALTVLVAAALLRDTEHHMAEIVYATPVTKARYLVGRLGGALLVAAAAFAFGIVGMVGGLLRHEPSRLSPFSLLPYLWSFVVLVLPTLLFVGALLFTIAALTRSMLATGVGGVFVYVLYMAAASLTSSPFLASSGPTSARELATAALVDPFAISAVLEQSRYWTAAERGVRSIALTGNLLLNRILWTAAALALVALAHRVFAFRVVGASRGKPGDGPRANRDETTPAAVYRPVAQGTSLWPALLSSLRLEVSALRRSWPLLAMLVLLVFVLGMEVVENLRKVEFRTALLPTAGLLIAQFEQPLHLFGLLVLVYFSAEVVWRERSVRMFELVDATPASSAALLASKIGALWVVVGALVATAVVVGLASQAALAHRPFELAVLLSLFWFRGLPLALFTVLAVLIQTLLPNRYVGMLGVLFAALFLPLGAPGGPEHPLLRFAAPGPLTYSDLNGFGPAASAFAVLMAYWTALASTLALVTYGLWPRGTRAPLARRLRALPRAWGWTARIAAAACVLVSAGLGGVLFHQINVVNGYQGPDARTAGRADYERTYGNVRALAQPEIADVRAEVDLFPGERRYRVHGRYRLQNTSGQTIERVWCSVRRAVRVAGLSLDGRSPVAVDGRFGMYVFDAALAPGGQADLSFDLEVARRGLAAEVENDIVDNGSFIWGPAVFPVLGYRRAMEIADAEERQRHGLPARTPPAVQPPALATFDYVVSAPLDQVVAAPGVLVESWEQSGRRYARFAAERPVVLLPAVAAARYASLRAQAGPVAVEVLHHPAHAGNAERVLEAATRSLAYFTRSFGPYPYPALRIAEITAYEDRFAGFALPGVVFFTEHRGFLTDLRQEGSVDIVTKRTAHEVAHQWWGHQVTPPEAPGSSAVVETLARYSELMILKERHGAAALTPVLQEELDRYLSGRTGEAEVPLDQVDDQRYLSYAKGALVMMALHDLIGEGEVNRALRALVDQARGASRAVTVRDLLRHLRSVTPAEFHSLLEEWWTKTVLYDLRVASATATPLPDGRYRLDARVEGRKFEAGAHGEAPLPMNEVLEIAVFANDPSVDSSAPALYSARHAIAGTTDLALVVDRPPTWIAIDPRLTRIDRNPEDNLRKIEPASGPER